MMYAWSLLLLISVGYMRISGICSGRSRRAVQVVSRVHRYKEGRDQSALPIHGCTKLVWYSIVYAYNKADSQARHEKSLRMRASTLSEHIEFDS